ncbi:MAG: hypothetical protein ACJ8D0_14420 [Xanthobacteraceae bacterium]
MLPKVRLILAVTTAAFVVAALGFGLFSRNTSVFAIGLHSARGAPLERSLPEPPDWKQFIALAALRRAEELNRLLDLPNPEPPAAPGESAEQAPTAPPESVAVNTPDGAPAPEPEPMREPSATTEPAVAAASASPPRPTAEVPAAEVAAPASPARLDEPPPAEAAVSQAPEPAAVAAASSTSQALANEPPTAAADVSVPSPALEPPPAEAASFGHPESEPPPAGVAMAIPQPPETESVPAPAEVAPAQAEPARAARTEGATTLALRSTSAPENAVEKPTTAAVPLPRPAPPRTNVRHPARPKAQRPVRTKTAHATRAVNARAARTRPVGEPAANLPSVHPFSGLYQQSHPSQ